MSSILDNPGVRESALRLDVDQYHRLCGVGIIPENTELVAGIVVNKKGKSPLHTWTVQFLADWFRENIVASYLRVEQPLTLGPSEPEPDLALVEGRRDDFRTTHPSTAELIAEVAISSEDLDREKATIYAGAGVHQYWLVLPRERQVIVFEAPKENVYTKITTLIATDELRVRDNVLKLSELFAS